MADRFDRWPEAPIWEVTLGDFAGRRGCGSQLERRSDRIQVVEFVWDLQKAAGNLRKHGVAFREATSVFGDWLGTTASDPDHSVGESRFITVGLSNQSRLLLVSHTDRDGSLRIISARTLTPKEKKVYESAREKHN